ncbi:MAG: LysM peptidoglycan-binding domain-containing protein [Nitrospirae bacterium]|nr:LysM peptidoglycan-binding domain-containing protein [Nitrospirota bacterium]
MRQSRRPSPVHLQAHPGGLLLIGALLMAIGVTGCTRSFLNGDPYSMPEVLKAELDRAQQSAKELRAEVDKLQNELAVTRIAKAQLEGTLRDAERRAGESRQVIELQREELARARNERERVVTTGKDLNAQLTSLQAQMAEQARLQQQLVELVQRPPRSGGSGRARRMEMETSSGGATTPPAPKPMAIHIGSRSKVNGAATLKKLEVKRGDTLRSISRQYGVAVTELTTLNSITEPDRILVGQILLLPSSAQEPGLENEAPMEPTPPSP